METKSGLKFLIDIDDAERVKAHVWYAGSLRHDRQGRPRQRVIRFLDSPKGSTQSLARFIISAPKGVDVSHRNGDLLDCRKENLELMTHKVLLRNLGAKTRKEGAAITCKKLADGIEDALSKGVYRRSVRLLLEKLVRELRDRTPRHLPYATLRQRLEANCYLSLGQDDGLAETTADNN